MPLAIKELHIKVSVNDGQPEKVNATNESSEKEAIVQMCVAKVLDILKRKMER